MNKFAVTAFFGFPDDENRKQMVPQSVVCNQWVKQRRFNSR